MDTASQDTDHSKEIFEKFSNLDILLIQAISDSALKVEGSLTKEQLDDLTDELLHLNGARKRSFFHRGFFDALFSSKVDLKHNGGDSESRLWYATGAAIAWSRQRMSEQVVELFSRERGLFGELSEDRNISRLQMLLPVLYPAFFSEGVHRDAANILSTGLSALGNAAFETELIQQVLDDAASLLREGDATTALAYFKAIGEIPLSGDDVKPDIASFGRRLLRKKAQCLQMLEQMEAAEADLKRLSELGDFEESIEAISDLGLIVGGFRSLYDILPNENQEQFESRIHALKRGTPYFLDAVSRESSKNGSRSRNARFSLGILELFQTKNPQEAAKHLTIALTGMAEDESLYRVGNLLAWAKLLLGLSLLETCDETRFNSSASNIRSSLQTEARFPAWILIRCLETSALFEDSGLSSTIADAILKRVGTDAFPKIRSANVLQKMPTMLGKYIDWVKAANLSILQQEAEWTFALKASLECNKINLAERSLEELESLAHQWHEYVDRFLALLEHSSNYSPAWSPYDAEEASIRVLEATGRFEEAAILLKRRFWTARAERSPQSKADCESILAALEEMRCREDEVEALRQSLPGRPEVEDVSQTNSELAEQKLKAGLPVSILFVGGNEIQAQYDKQITDEITSMFPGVSIQFEHPGWGSNWAPLCDEIERNLGNYDAVVLSHLVRTNMGRRMRRICGAGTPWFACRGKGGASIKRSIEEAAVRSVELRHINPQV